MDSIFTRRSIRRYKDIKVEEEKIDKMLRAAMQAPSAMNQQPWEFIVVENKEALKQLSKVHMYAGLIENAPLAVVICGNENVMRAPEKWEQDLGAATQNLLLAATQLELGSVWIGIAPVRERMDYIKDMFNLPSNIKPYCVVAVGYPAEGHNNKFVDRYDEDKVHYVK